MRSAKSYCFEIWGMNLDQRGLKIQEHLSQMLSLLGLLLLRLWFVNQQAAMHCSKIIFGLRHNFEGESSYPVLHTYFIFITCQILLRKHFPALQY